MIFLQTKVMATNFDKYNTRHIFVVIRIEGDKIFYNDSEYYLEDDVYDWKPSEGELPWYGMNGSKPIKRTEGTHDIIYCEYGSTDFCFPVIRGFQSMEGIKKFYDTDWYLN